MKTMAQLAWNLSAGLLLMVSITLPVHAADKPAAIGTLPQAALDQALAYPAFRFNRHLKGGAHTWGSFSGGSLPALALAAYAGNESAAKTCAERLKNFLKGKNAPTATGGYPAQHELLFAASAVIMKNGEQTWDLLSKEEQSKIDLLVKALLIASAYTTSDKNYVEGKPTCLHGGSNHSRGWNPNYREGMIGMLLVAGCYFGPEEAQNILDTYKHDEFVAELKAAGLSNTHETFTFHSQNKKAPSGKQIETAVHQFRYLGKNIHDPMDLYEGLTKNTFGRNVEAGVNGGKGIKDAAKIVSGADKLPNKGKPGMLLEFDSKDAGGVRSSAGYASHGFRPNIINQAALICSGHWVDNKVSKELVALVDVGATDLHYKLKHGYKDYHKGKVRRVVSIDDKGQDHHIVHSIWEDVLKPYHDQATSK